MFNKNKLRAKIFEAGYTIKEIAVFLNRNEATVYRKMNNGEFTRKEMLILKEVLNLDDKTFQETFFA